MTSVAAGADEDTPPHAPAATSVAESPARTGGDHADDVAAGEDEDGSTDEGSADEDGSGGPDAEDATEDAEDAGDVQDAEEGPTDQPTTRLRADTLTAPKDAGSKSAPKDAQSKAAPKGAGSNAVPKDAEPKAKDEKAAPRDVEPEAASKAADAKAAPRDVEPEPAPKVTDAKAAPEDAEPKAAPQDAESRPAPKAADAKATPKDADPKPAPKDAEPKPAPQGEPVVRPLVSDLYGRSADEPGGAVAFGKPGTPTRARTVPTEAPASPAKGKAPLPPAAVPETGESEAVGPQGTRTMPVPPTPDKDPLKLLAELTNTPPPPETLLRTSVRRVKIWTPLVVLLALAFVLVQALRPLPAPSLASTTAPSYTFSGTALPQSMPWPSQGQSAVEVEGLGSLGVHGAQTPVPIASVTKVMTAYVVLHDHPLSGKENGPLITVDAQAAAESQSTEESTAKVKKGQKFTERQMLQLLLIPSGNNIARLLARWDAGTQEAFVAKMMKTAKGLGMTHTTYTGASGFESTTQSTAVDLLKLAREVMKNDVFRSVVAMPNADIPGVGTIYNNNNDLVNLGVVGVKTGSSTPAGGALMWAAHRTIDGKQQLILGVVLQQRGGVTVNDSLNVALTRSQALINSVQGGLTSATILKKGEVVGEVDDGLGGSTPVVASADLKAIGWPGMTAKVTLDPLTGGIPHDAKAGTEVGTIGFGTGSARTTVPVVLQTDLHAPSFGKKLTRLG
ncbi:D-alanyl-D-alanine carboxypeptidase family protein [Actinacidiphila acidipaludis]|uniref:D-alanyl-D-alanine carboxypeptidase family protein n=1 Tax=Actinacidiphila acidipaludis TaxID=2873382 RepID=UPI0027E1DBAF|nr:D-alanyl-D-alanine carboxypeptidase [Streptomyces acidipaludis]